MSALRLLKSFGDPFSENCESNVTSGSSYTSVENRITQKSNAVLIGINYKAMSTGNHTVTLYQDSTQLATKTMNLTATGWNTILFDDQVNLLANTQYRIIITRPSGPVYYNNGSLFDGTYWQNNQCYFGANPYSYTIATGMRYVPEEYSESGTAVYGPYSLPVVESFRLSNIRWDEIIPDDTSLAVYTGLADPEDEPETWDLCTNDDEIPTLTAGKDLYIKVAMSTSDVRVTPEISSLSFMYEGSEDHSVVRIKLTETGRLKHPQGNVTVGYTAALGNLKNAAGTLSISSFEQAFNPDEENLELFFNPQDVENIAASIDLSVEVNKVTFHNRKSADENIEAGIDLSVAVYDTEDNPV